jgi:toxin ParE1/3/4
MEAVSVSFHPDAMEEYIASYAWYYERGSHLAQAFESEIERALRLVSDSPERWPVYKGRYRRILVRRFPFSVVYTRNERGILVIAVAHGHRRPGYWKDRSGN